MDQIIHEIKETYINSLDLKTMTRIKIIVEKAAY